MEVRAVPCQGCGSCGHRATCVVAKHVAPLPLKVEFFQWAGTAVAIVGAILISWKATYSTLWWVFALFLVGHIVWAASGYVTKGRAIIGLNLMMIPFDIWAIMTRL